MKNADDVRILKKIIEKQNTEYEFGVEMPTDLDDRRYKWNEKGRLTELWLACLHLGGTLDVSGLTALKYLDCSKNHITGLELNGCSRLTTIVCTRNRLTDIDLSECPEIEYLDCRDNILTELSFNSPKLQHLDCCHNPLAELDISGCPALKYLDCCNTQIGILDIQTNPALKVLYYDEDVRVWEEEQKERE